MIALVRLLVRLLEWPLSVGCREPRQADAIVVLGAPIRASGELSPAAQERVEVALLLYRENLAPIVCVTGGHMPRAQAGSLLEADGMARWLRAGGVPNDRLRVDRLSTTTRENAARTAELLLPENVRTVCLVTQPFHSRRARFLFRAAGFAAEVQLIERGLTERAPFAALRWIVREYGAWLLLAFRRLTMR